MAKYLLTSILLFSFYCSFSQDIVKADRSNYFKWRTNNVLEFGLGIATPNFDFPEPEIDLYGTIGYKAVIFPHVRLGLSYHVFDLEVVKFKESFMSFDVNAEFILLPYDRFTPFVFIGSGYNASQDFNNTELKMQGGGGIEYMFMRNLGVKVFMDYNYLLSDEIENLEFGDSNDTYLRFGAGINFYFGRTKKRKNLKGKDTIFKRNEIKQ